MFVVMILGLGLAVWNQLNTPRYGSSSTQSDKGAVPTPVSDIGLAEARPAALPAHEQRPATASPPTSHTAFIVGLRDGDRLNVRAIPAANSKAVFTLTNGEEVQIRGDAVLNGETKWVPIKVGEQQGWITNSYMRIKPH